MRLKNVVCCSKTRITRQFDINNSDLKIIEQGVLLHDIGKIGIPDELLRKPDKLTESEWVLMRKHPEIGYRILKRIKFLEKAAELVLHHHERYDGTGYPGHLKSDEINLGARIFAIADSLECLTSDRPFQAAISFESARKEIARLAGTQLDPKIVKEFLKIPVEEWAAIRKEVAASAGRSEILSDETMDLPQLNYVNP
jgi:HD-GYP domain-containing protein (c-di-GMP phosphodiesterase class II)